MFQQNSLCEYEVVFDVKPTWDETSLKNFSSFLLPMLVIKTLIPTQTYVNLLKNKTKKNQTFMDVLVILEPNGRLKIDFKKLENVNQIIKQFIQQKRLPP